VDELDEYAVLAAIWILASNDETSLITYRGVQQRLNLPAGYDIRGTGSPPRRAIPEANACLDIEAMERRDACR
jgi:hypothetical protein